VSNPAVEMEDSVDNVAGGEPPVTSVSRFDNEDDSSLIRQTAAAAAADDDDADVGEEVPLVAANAESVSSLAFCPPLLFLSLSFRYFSCYLSGAYFFHALHTNVILLCRESDLPDMVSGHLPTLHHASGTPYRLT